MRFTVDSNILVYSLDTKGREKHQRAVEIMSAALGGDAVLPAQVIGEFLSVIRKKFRDALPTALVLVDRWTSMIRTAATTADHMLAAARQAEDHRMQFWDCVIWQVARSERVDLLLSEDMHDGLMLSGVRVVNPFAEANDGLVQRLLRDSHV